MPSLRLAVCENALNFFLAACHLTGKTASLQAYAWADRTYTNVVLCQPACHGFMKEQYLSDFEVRFVSQCTGAVNIMSLS